jgi:heme-degrading monooxygenase HmoA
MIKVIIKRQVKKGEDISLLLLEIRAAAMRQPGYVSGETLLSTEDSFNIVTISTWRTLEDWKAWEASKERAKLCQRFEPLLVEKPKVRTYGIRSTENRN